VGTSYPWNKPQVQLSGGFGLPQYGSKFTKNCISICNSLDLDLDQCRLTSRLPPHVTTSTVQPTDEGVDDEALERVVAEEPSGALALSGLTIGLLLLAWFLVCAFVFLPRGMVS
jgi:hypothetical protein